VQRGECKKVTKFSDVHDIVEIEHGGGTRKSERSKGAGASPVPASELSIDFFSKCAIRAGIACMTGIMHAARVETDRFSLGAGNGGGTAESSSEATPKIVLVWLPARVLKIVPSKATPDHDNTNGGIRISQYTISKEEATIITNEHQGDVISFGAYAPRYSTKPCFSGDKRHGVVNYSTNSSNNGEDIKEYDAEALAAVPSSEIVKLWLVDTGCASDLIARKDVAHLEEHFQTAAKPMMFRTANGTTAATTVIVLRHPGMESNIAPYIIKDTPAVMSVGKKVMHENYGFHWPGKKGFLTSLPPGAN